MAISLPPKFLSDIQGKDTALVPIVKIGEIYISTNSFSGYKPLLLNIPSLKESIDLETRKYKISSVNLDISNYPYEGKRFTELFNTSLMNVNVDIYWVSPSTAIDDEALHIYSGKVRRYDHDDEKVKIVVEDRSQATLHKDLPTAELGFDDDVPDKYRGKKIPMVYGHVDRSPCVIESKELGIDRSVSADSVNVQIGFAYDNNGTTIGNNPLWIFKDDIWVQMLEDIADNYYLDYEFNDLRQYKADPNSSQKIILINSYRGLDEGLGGDYKIGGNPISHNKAIGIYKSIPSGIKNFNYDDNYITGNIGSWTASIEASYEIGLSGYINLWWDGWYQDNASTNVPNFGSTRRKNAYQYNYPLANDDTPIKHQIKGKIILTNFSQASSNGYNEVYILTGQFNQDFLASAFDSWYDEDFAFDDGTEYTNATGNGATLDIEKTYNIAGSPSLLPAALIFEVYFIPHNLTASEDSGYSDVNILFDDGYPNVSVYPLINNFFESNFYVNVNGRKMDGDDNSPTAPEVIANIIGTELGVAGIDDTGTASYNGWEYAFTVDKKINSKKLLEGLASASPYIPRFDNMGNFKIDVIPKTGGNISTDLGGNETIKEADVIDFSFSRTKIEDVKTKVELKYKLDYARDEFGAEPIVVDVIDLFGEDHSDNIFNYYGLQGTGSDPHSESTLVVEEQGKYIRDPDTAKYFAFWLLSWYANQHLKLKVKLPLKYMNIEIGDIVDFDKLLGGIKPYNSSYVNADPNVKIADSINGQTRYTNFIITSTNKTLEFCEIECLQLHRLSEEVLVYGCMDSTACNYDHDNPANAPDPDNPCWYPIGDCTCADGIGVVDNGCGCGEDAPSGCNDWCEGDEGSASEIGCDGVCGSGLEDCGCGCGVICVDSNNDGDWDCEQTCAEIGGTICCDGACAPSGQECIMQYDECGVCYEYLFDEEYDPYDDDGCCPNSPADCAGVCGGTSELMGCDEGCNSTAVNDECGVCGGEGIPDWACGCADDDGVFPVLDCSGVCGGTCSDCDGCPEIDAINYDPDACGEPEDCLYPFESDPNSDWACPVEQINGEDTLNYICNDPIAGLSRCDAAPDWIEGDVLIPNNSVFYPALFGNSYEEMMLAIQGYCLENDCSANNQTNLNSDYPLVLYTSNCMLSITGLQAEYVYLIFRHTQTGAIEKEILVYQRGEDMVVVEDILTIGQYNAMRVMGNYSIDMRIEVSYSNELNSDILTLNYPNIQIMHQSEGCDGNYEWIAQNIGGGGVSDTLEASSGDTEIDFVVSEQGNLTATETHWTDHYCEVDGDKLFKFKVALFSETNEFPILDDMGEVELELVVPACPSVGDVNDDGTQNILDVVALANCVLANNCYELEHACAADMNGDDAYNVLDVVALVNCVLANNCGEPPPPPVPGCTDDTACNYVSNATQDDGSCEHAEYPCPEGSAGFPCTVCHPNQCSEPCFG